MFWYGYALIRNQQGLSTKGNFNLSNWFEWKVFLDPKFYSNIFGYELNLILLPVGILLFFLGLTYKLKGATTFLYPWLGFTLIYFLIFNKHTMSHEYYHLPLLPVTSIFIGISIEKLLVKNTSIFPRNFILIFLMFILFFLMFPVTLRNAYKPIERFAWVLETADAIKKLTDPNDIVIGSIDSSPALIYYSDRFGWTFDVTQPKSIEKLEKLKGEGAVIFASANKKQLQTNEPLTNYLYSHYQEISDSDNYAIFNLRSGKHF